jgi:hypothetical protein
MNMIWLETGEGEILSAYFEEFDLDADKVGND